MIVAALEIAILALLVWGACQDVLSFRLPNWLTLTTAVIATSLVALTSAQMVDLVWHVGFGIAVLLVGLLMFRFNLLGGGDVKWLAALAIWIGPDLAFLRFLLLMGLAGGVLAIVMLVVRRLCPAYGKQEGRTHLPYGVAIAVAGLEYWLQHSVLMPSFQT